MNKPTDAIVSDDDPQLDKFGECMYAFIAENDGLVAAKLDDVWAPFIAANPRTADLLKSRAAEIAKLSGKTITLYKYGSREAVEVFKP